MGILTIISLISVVVPLINAGIDLAEKVFTGKGKGQEKKEAVLTGLGNAWDNPMVEKVLGKELASTKKEDVLPIASMMIDLLVSILNKAGVFKNTLEEESPKQTF